MRRFILCLLLLAAAIWLGLKIQADPGYVLIAYQHWTLETPLWFGVLAVLVSFIVLYIIVRLIKRTTQLGERIRSWSRLRRIRQSQTRTNQGLIEFTEGNWQAAERYLLNAVSRSDTPLINYLAAAKAAQEQNAYERRDDYLRKAHESTPGAEIAVGLTQAQLQLSQGQWEQCLATLRHVQSLAPQHKLTLQLLKTVYLKLNDWQNLLDLLPSLRKCKALDADETDALALEIYHELLAVAQQDSLQALQDTWSKFSKSLRKEPALIDRYVGYLLTYKADAIAEPLLVESLKKQLDDRLLTRYGLIVGEQPNKQLTNAEHWLKENDPSPTLLTCLGRLCLRNQLWGKAQDYFERSLNIADDAEVYYELGQLYERLHESEKAKAAFAQALALDYPQVIALT